MKAAIRFVPVALVSVLMGADTNVVQPGSFVVHEWGTFTSVAGEDGSAMDWDALGCKDDLPGFVNVRGYRGFKFGLQGTVRMETPVLYFYSPRALEAQVKVQFPHGVITEWYPNGETAIYESKKLMDRMGVSLRTRIYPDDAVYQTKTLVNPPPQGLDPLLVKLSPSLNGIDTSLHELMGAIEWKTVKVQPGASPALPVEGDPSRYYAARGTDSTPLAVGDQHEKFLFYRGIGRFPVPLSARIASDGKIQVENRGQDSVPTVILFENRGGRVGYRSAGAVNGAASLDPPALNGAFAALQADLETALVAQGLFAKEAQAMIDTWRDSWFEEGSRLIYIVPASAVDTVLPLQVEPAPSQTARVFVGRIELITPATLRAVEAAMAGSDWTTLDRYARFLGPILTRISAESPQKANQVMQLRRNIPFIAGGNCR